MLRFDRGASEMSCILCSIARHGGIPLFSMKRFEYRLMSSYNFPPSSFLHAKSFIPVLTSRISISTNFWHLFTILFAWPVIMRSIERPFFFLLNDEPFTKTRIAGASGSRHLNPKSMDLRILLGLCQGHHFALYLIDVFASDGKAKLALSIYPYLHTFLDPTQ